MSDGWGRIYRGLQRTYEAGGRKSEVRGQNSPYGTRSNRTPRNYQTHFAYTNKRSLMAAQPQSGMKAAITGWSGKWNEQALIWISSYRHRKTNAPVADQGQQINRGRDQ